MPWRPLNSLVCFAAAVAWPEIFSAGRQALMSPYERLLTTSFCGDSAHTAFALAGHCAACWTGSAALIALGFTVLFRTKPMRARI